MADERALAQEDQWWAVDALPDSLSPALSFDEPLQWPETPAFAREPAAADTAPPEAVPADTAPPEAVPADTAPPLPFDPPPPAAPEGRAADPDDGWLAALDLSPLDGAGPQEPAGPPPDDGLDLHFDPLPEALWAADPDVAEEPPGTAVPPAPEPEPLLVTSATASPAPYAEPEQAPRSWKPRRPDLRHGNAAVIAAISFVSLVLMGMFLSVRARNDMSTTDTSPPPSAGQIVAQGSLNTIPTPTTAATTTTAPPAIALTDLLPPPDTTADATAEAGSGGGGGGGAPRPAAPATTAAPARSAAPSGGGGSGGGGSPSPPAATNPPADPPADQPDTTPAPDPPVDDTRPRPPRTTPTTATTTPDPDITVPTITVPDGMDRPSFAWPSGQRPDRDD